MAGGTQRLSRLAGRGLATEMVLTGRLLTSEEALAVGLLSAVCEPPALLDTASKIASSLASRGPLAIRLGKEAVHRGMEMPLEQALRYETDLTVLLQTRRTARRGSVPSSRSVNRVLAVVERRPRPPSLGCDQCPAYPLD